MLTRRHFNLSLGVALLSGCAPHGQMRRKQGAAEALVAAMDYVYDDIVLTDPETLAQFGLDHGERAWAKSQLSTRSMDGIKKRQGLTREALRRFEAIDRTQLSGMAVIDYDTLASLYRRLVKAYDDFDYGTHSWPEPYVVSQLGGSYRTIPDFLASKHKIETAADCEAYLARLSAFARELDHETEHMRADAGIGVIPPDFVVDRTVPLLGNLTKVSAGQSPMVVSLVKRAQDKGLAGDWQARAERLVEREIYPAVARQAQLLQEQRPRAVHDAGVWRLPDGEAYYAYALEFGTTTRMTAEEIHRLGLVRMAELTSRADRLLKSQGMTQGTVAERIRALGRDPRFVYPNTDQGKADLIAALNQQMAEMRRRLPEQFGRLPKADVEIRRIPVEIEAGATGGYYQLPSLDGSRPGAYFINLRDTAEQPSWSLPTLTYHEAIPGHHMQLSLALETTELHRLRRLAPFSAYSEGWALYAEQLADEMGVYRDDPFGEIGYLSSVMMRAARLVVDTGLHHRRWSLEQAIGYLMDTLGNEKATLVTEAERYCVWPGQATSYMVGQQQWVRLRESARQKLGEKFDVRAFHDRALSAGVIPLSVLETVINEWAASA